MRYMVLALLTMAVIGTSVPLKVEPPGVVAGWKSAEVINLELGVQAIGGPSFDNFTFFEFTLARFGAGFMPPAGAGIWVRLWAGDMVYGEPVASLRISYTPYLSWKQRKDDYLRYTRLDLFAEPGYMFVWTKEWLWRTGVSFSIAIPPCFLPINVEAGWIFKDYFDRSGSYLIASTSLLGIEQPIKRENLQDFSITHQFSSLKQGLSTWLGFEFLSVGRVVPDDSFVLRHPVDDVELCLLKIGAGIAPPVGLGLWTRIWAGALSDWWWGMPWLSLRLTYSPFMLFKESKPGRDRVARFDIFAEYGFAEDNKHTFRTGISSNISFIPWLTPVTVEAGWATFPVWSSYTSGIYFLLSTSAFGGDFALKKNKR